MLTYLIRRVLLMFPTLIGITLVVFAVMAAAPGGMTAQSLVGGQNLEPQAKQALTQYYDRLYGLDQPASIQYLRWLNNISPAGFVLDDNHEIEKFSFTKGSYFGTSFRYGRPVLDLITERLPITLLLNLISLPLIYGIAIAIGVHAATKRGSTFDVASGTTLLALWSIPSMLAGIALIGLFASDQHWHWFPTAGLSEREALDMTFLPWWTTSQALFTAIGSAFAGLLIAGLAARVEVTTLRVVAFGAAGGWLGAEMGWAHATNDTLLLIGTTAIGGALLGAGLAALQPAALRVCIAIGFGFTVGALFGIEAHPESFTRGFLLDRLWHLVLPVLCLAYGGVAFLAKLMRTAVLENLDADFARTARAKGADEQTVLWRHVFRNSLLPLITVSAGLLPALLGGSVIVESIFSIDGMGKLAVEAVKGRDRELVLSLTLVSGFLTLVGYFVADLCYALADPRVSYQ
jgi:ABC-type dipeptide/oligopeptide/nickel transport system permease component